MTKLMMVMMMKRYVNNSGNCDSEVKVRRTDTIAARFSSAVMSC